MDRLHWPSATLLVLAALIAAACSGAAAPVAPNGPRLTGSELDAAGADDGERPPGEEQPDQVPGESDQLIVYTGTIELEVADLAASVAQAEQFVARLGGHVAASRAQDSTHSSYASITFRIPAPRWSEALAGLRALGTRVVDEATGSEDVTEQVVDLDARLANLAVTETALQAIMDRATTIDEVLKVQRELTGVRSEIERLVAQRDDLSSRAALGTLTVTFGVPVAELSVASESWNLGHEVDAAVAALVRLGQWAASVTVWLVIVVVPVFTPILAAIYLALRVRRRWLATHPAA